MVYVVLVTPPVRDTNAAFIFQYSVFIRCKIEKV